MTAPKTWRVTFLCTGGEDDGPSVATIQRWREQIGNGEADIYDHNAHADEKDSYADEYDRRHSYDR